MLFALGSYFVNVGPMIESGDEYERAGAPIDTTLGTGVLLGVWALGDLILGLFVLLTRSK